MSKQGKKVDAMKQLENIDLLETLKQEKLKIEK